MKLSCHPTNPLTRTVLAFDESELRAALILYAEKRGYVFSVSPIDKSEFFYVWHPNQNRGLGSDTTKLVVDLPGTDAAITKKPQ